MVEYLDFNSEESVEEDSNVCPLGQLPHQYGMQPTQSQKIKTTDLTELFDMTFQRNDEKGNQEK